MRFLYSSYIHSRNESCPDSGKHLSLNHDHAHNGCVSPISKTCANSFFDRSFVYAAPTLWNALDLDIRLLPFDTFKKVSRHVFIFIFVN